MPPRSHRRTSPPPRDRRWQDPPRRALVRVRLQTTGPANGQERVWRPRARSARATKLRRVCGVTMQSTNACARWLLGRAVSRRDPVYIAIPSPVHVDSMGNVFWAGQGRQRSSNFGSRVQLPCHGRTDIPSRGTLFQSSAPHAESDSCRCHAGVTTPASVPVVQATSTGSAPVTGGSGTTVISTPAGVASGTTPGVAGEQLLGHSSCWS